MRIAIVAPSYLPARRANTIQVMKMAQALQNSGHQLHLSVPGTHPTYASEKALWDEMQHHYGLHCPPFQIEWLPTHSLLRRYDFGLSAVHRAQTWKADLLYTRLPQAALFAALSGISTIFEVHDLPQGPAGNLLFRLFLQRKSHRRLVVITQALAKELHTRYGAPVSPPFTIIAPDGVDLERYQNLPSPSEARRRLNLPDRFTAGYTGHLYAGRGLEIILALAARFPQISFLLAGGEALQTGELQEKIQAQAMDNVMINGFIPNADLPLYQAACEVLLMPYQQQVAASSGGDIAHYLSPMKMFEYLACGRAILSTDLPVLKEVLNSQNSVLLPPENVNAWQIALQELQTRPELLDQLSAQARKDAQNYSWDERARRILSGLMVSSSNQSPTVNSSGRSSQG